MPVACVMVGAEKNRSGATRLGEGDAHSPGGAGGWSSPEGPLTTFKWWRRRKGRAHRGRNGTESTTGPPRDDGAREGREDAGSGRGIRAGLTGRASGAKLRCLDLSVGGEDPGLGLCSRCRCRMEGKLEEGRPGVQCGGAGGAVLRRREQERCGRTEPQDPRRWRQGGADWGAGVGL